MPLINRSSQSIYWRIFNSIDRARVLGISPFEGVVPPGGQVGIGFSASAFQLEILDRPPSLIPASRVLVPAGPPGVVGQLYRSSDTLEYMGGTDLRLTTLERMAVPGFLPSTHGFRFTNQFPANTEHARVRVGNTVMAIGDAANGLCGGMVYAVRDYFHAGIAIPQHRQGPLSGPLYEYIVRRLYDSFALPLGWTEYLRLMSTACTAGDRASTAYFTSLDRIRTDLQNGAPSPIGLIQVSTDDPTKVGQNHQVLVYGLERTGRQVTLRIYDPNFPVRDDITMSFDTSQTPANFRYSVTLGGSGRILSFFSHQYVSQQPPASSTIPPWTEFPYRNPLVPGASCLFLANGWLGLFKIDRVTGNSFIGTVFGQHMEGSWDPTRRTIRFTRHIEPTYKQVYTGVLAFDPAKREWTGIISGEFEELRGTQTLTGRYPWQAASRLVADGNGWLGELRVHSLQSDGTLVGDLYGDATTGRWNQATQQLTLTRRSQDINYRQEWRGRRTNGLTFAGDFQEVSRGVIQPKQYRWMAYDQR